VRRYPGYFEITLTIPGVTRKKTLRLADDIEIYRYGESYPVGTKIVVWIPSLNIGYGRTVRPGGIVS